MIKYHKEHAWVKIEDGEAFVGISQFAQEELGELVYVDLPAEGDELVAGEEFGQIESTKTTSELIAPASGEVIESNLLLEDNPGLINDSPENRGWITKIKLTAPEELDGLMESGDYLASLED